MTEMLPWKLFRPVETPSMRTLLIAMSTVAHQDPFKTTTPPTPLERFVRSRIFEPRVMALVSMFQGTVNCARAGGAAELAL